jgi:large subunit ribosomal protein L1
MDRKEILEALKAIRESSKKRNFTESIDLIINLKGLNIKREEEKVSAYIPLPHDRGKKTRISALIGDALSTKAKGTCDNIILEADFKKQDKKSIKRLAEKTDFFIAQADIMPKVAASFGRTLGPRGMMPNPKAGCVIPSTADLKPLVERLQKTVKIETKNEQVVKARIGLASLEDEKLADNALAIYNYIIHHVPQEKNNIKNVIIKLSMGKPFVIGSKKEVKK